MVQSTNFAIVFGELLPQILLHSPTSDLIGFRLVSRRWKHEATLILLQRRDLKIQFEWTKLRPFQDHSMLYSFKTGERSKWQECEYHPESFKQLESLPEDRSLSSLFQLLTPPPHQVSPSLPIDHLDFRCQFWGVNYPQLSSFLLMYGQKIRALTLNNHAFATEGHLDMTNSILQYTPNIESLYLRQDLHWQNPIQNFGVEQNNRVSLGRLKFLEIGHETVRNWDSLRRMYEQLFGILPHLLNCAHQLERLFFQSYFDPSFLRPFLLSKINLLQIETLFLTANDLFSDTGVEASTKLAEVMMKNSQGCGLKRLRICVNWDTWPRWPQTLDSWKRGISVIRSVLAANVKSLDKIELIAGAALVLHKIPHLPRLPKVTKLTVDLLTHGGFVDAANPDSILVFVDENSPGVLLSRLMPNLETLDLLNWHFQEEDTHQKWFPYWKDELRKVQTLKAKAMNCGGGGGGRVTQAYALSLKLCPVVSSFSTYWKFYDFPTLFLPIWNGMQQLTSLHLEFIHRNTPPETFVDLDSAITGMSKELVSAIYKNYQETGQLKEVPSAHFTSVVQDDKPLRTANNSSIVNLQNLRKLHLEFYSNALDKPKMVISQVSAKFGFALIQDLQVLLAFNFSSTCLCFCLTPDQQSKKEEWLNLHRPLSSLANVTVGLKKDVACCDILHGPRDSC